MYVLLTDETNNQASVDVKFFAYGGLFFRFELLPELDAAIRSIRSHFGFKPTDQFKFNIKSRPEGMDPKAHTAAKDAVLDLCIEKDCRFISYVVHHAITNEEKAEERLTFAADHILKAFHDFLDLSKDTGIVLMDSLPITKADAYLRDKFQVGLNYPKIGIKTPLHRIHLYGTTGIGMSHVASMIDIVLGSFRYCINNPKNPVVADKLFKKVLQIMWYQEADGKRTVNNRGLILRPKKVTNPEYRADYDSLIESLRTYAT